MKKQPILWAALGLALLSTSAHSIESTPELKASVFYSLGGGAPLAKSTTKKTQVFDIGFNANLDALLKSSSCSSSFDLGSTVTATMSGATDGLKTLFDSIIASAQAWVANLPMQMLQKANPAFYDQLQNLMAAGKASFEVGQMTCQDFSRMMDGEGVEWDKYVSLSKGYDWKSKMGAASNAANAPVQSKFGTAKSQSQQAEGDVVAVQKEIDSNAGTNGIPTPDGNRGGDGQAALEVGALTVRYGYNMLAGRGTAGLSRTDALSITEKNNYPVGDSWASPGDAVAFSESVLGDEIIQTCDGCEKMRSKPGKGLNYAYQIKQESLVSAITAIIGDIQSSPSLSRANIISRANNISVAGLRIFPEVLIGLAEEPVELQSSMIERLAAEIALADTLGKGLALKQILFAGKKTPEFSNATITANIDGKIADLQSQMESMIFEMEVRDRIAGNTMMELANRHYVRRHSPGSLPTNKGYIKALDNGAYPIPPSPAP